MAFGVRRSAFGVRRSAFGVRRSAFGVRRSAFGVRRSAFGVQRSAFGVRPLRRSAFGVRRSHLSPLTFHFSLSPRLSLLTKSFGCGFAGLCDLSARRKDRESLRVWPDT